MKKILVLALVVALVLVGGVMALPTGETTASLTVNEFVDITLGGVLPIAFGSVDPGTLDNPSGGTVTITIEATTNVVTDTYLKGADWTTPTTLAISNVKYGDGTLANATMSTVYGAADTGYFEDVACPCGGSAAAKSIDFWLSIPAGQEAGTYTATSIYIKTVKNGVTP